MYGIRRDGRDTYLSVDLDYWETAEPAKHFLRKVFAQSVPVSIVQDHHHLLRHANKMGTVIKHPKLINVDYHDDLMRTKPPPTMLSEGNWVSHIRWAKRGSYEWHYPLKKCRECSGLCDCERAWADNQVWGGLRQQRGLGGIDLDKVACVGIALSAEYWGGKRSDFYKLLDFLSEHTTGPDWARPALPFRVGRAARACVRNKEATYGASSSLLELGCR